MKSIISAAVTVLMLLSTGVSHAAAAYVKSDKFSNSNPEYPGCSSSICNETKYVSVPDAIGFYNDPIILLQGVWVYHVSNSAAVRGLTASVDLDSWDPISGELSYTISTDLHATGKITYDLDVHVAIFFSDQPYYYYTPSKTLTDSRGKTNVDVSSFTDTPTNPLFDSVTRARYTEFGGVGITKLSVRTTGSSAPTGTTKFGAYLVADWNATSATLTPTLVYSLYAPALAAQTVAASVTYVTIAANEQFRYEDTSEPGTGFDSKQVGCNVSNFFNTFLGFDATFQPNSGSDLYRQLALGISDDDSGYWHCQDAQWYRSGIIESQSGQANVRVYRSLKTIPW